MSNETVLDDYLEQLLGEASAAMDAAPAASGNQATAAAADAPEREPTWDDLPHEVVYETGAEVSDDVALMDETSLQAAFDDAARSDAGEAAREPTWDDLPDEVIHETGDAPDAGRVLDDSGAEPAAESGHAAPPPAAEPTWDDLPDEVIYETGDAVSAVLANADSPALEAAFEAAADPDAPPAAMTPVAPMAAPTFRGPPPSLPPRTVARATPAQDAPNANPPSTWQELQEQARQNGHASSPQRRAAERSSRWLRLRCGAQAYALELLKVQEVVLPVPLLPLRGTAPAMLGIMNLRGQVVPVMDLGIHLGGAPAEEDAQTRIVVLEENGEIMGLRVTAVEDVTNLSDSQIEPPDTARICRISNDIFRGVARLHQQPMILLDATQLLN